LLARQNDRKKPIILCYGYSFTGGNISNTLIINHIFPFSLLQQAKCDFGTKIALINLLLAENDATT
jgi:hypothetical protein